MGLKINVKKTEVMTLNVNNPGSVLMDGKTLPHVDTFTYLGSTVTTSGGAESDIKRRLSKARSALSQPAVCLEIWSIYNPDQTQTLQQLCLPVLLYGSECWRMTEQDQTSCLYSIPKV
ncbi:uncharacterized protein [Mytilus edulis]|uniref:uncharacterized protein n=1 Tax=Mytilus edulis TaxID=6550 RepID=UPI0039EE5928